MRFFTHTCCVLLSIALIGCGDGNNEKQQKNAESGADTTTTAATTTAGEVVLPQPFATESVNHYCDVIGWPDDKMPVAPAGFKVSKFADSLQNPRWIFIGPDGDIFVCETNGKNNIIQSVKATVSGKIKSANEKVRNDVSANRITLFRDNNNDGIPDMKSTFLTGLNHPLGMAIVGNMFYVANNDAVVAYPYTPGQTSITTKGRKITDLPGGSGHWTRNILASGDGKKLYVAVGSGSNVADDGIEKEEGKATIWEMNPDGTGKRKFATGIRNPVGMAWAPGTNTLWTAVNERDGLGDDLVPDYLTSVKDGGFYGWPYAYWGQHEDPRMKDKQRPDLVKSAIVPDVSMGPHTASLGLAFDDKRVMSGRFAGGAFVGQHGSWNRAQLSGYQVVFVPFKNGKPIGAMEPFLTGFVADADARKVYGRPVGVAFAKQGYMLVADDAANKIWCVRSAQ
jgi:glucose/arabinose dehydrogenase